MVNPIDVGLVVLGTTLANLLPVIVTGKANRRTKRFAARVADLLHIPEDPFRSGGSETPAGADKRAALRTDARRRVRREERPEEPPQERR